MEETKNIDTESTSVASKKKNKLPLVLNIVTGIVLVLAVVFLIEAFYAKKNLHNNYFGHAILPVASASMDSGEKGSIKKGDLIFVKLLNSTQKTKLKEGDVITFKFYISELGAEQLVTHRIRTVYGSGYTTHGDANPENSTEFINFDAVVGIYKGKIGGVGHVGLAFETKAGSFIMIVVPFILLLALASINFIRNMKIYNKHKIEDVTEAARSSVLEEEKERLRQEILREMENEKNKKE